jgi:hypothetical protein
VPTRPQACDVIGVVAGLHRHVRGARLAHGGGYCCFACRHRSTPSKARMCWRRATHTPACIACPITPTGNQWTRMRSVLSALHPHATPRSAAHNPCGATDAPQVGYGSFHFHRQTGGLVAIHSFKNPSTPELAFSTPSGAPASCRRPRRTPQLPLSWVEPTFAREAIGPARASKGVENLLEP